MKQFELPNMEIIDLGMTIDMFNSGDGGHLEEDQGEEREF